MKRSFLSVFSAALISLVNATADTYSDSNNNILETAESLRFELPMLNLSDGKHTAEAINKKLASYIEKKEDGTIIKNDTDNIYILILKNNGLEKLPSE